MQTLVEMSTSGHPVIRKLPTGVYMAGDLIVSPNIKDDVLLYAYNRMEREGTLREVFYEDVPGLGWFLQKYHELPVLGCFRQDKAQQVGQMLGLCWAAATAVVAKTLRKAEVGMAFFRREGTPTEYLRLGQLAVTWAFEQLSLDVLFGTTPEKNRAALAYLKRIGFTSLPLLPDYTVWQTRICGVYISYLKRAEWRERFPYEEG